MSNLPYIVQGQINKTIDETKVQKIKTNVQDENVSSLSYSQPFPSGAKIKPEPPKTSYEIKVVNGNSIGVQISAEVSLYDDIGSLRAHYGDVYTIVRDGNIIKEKLPTPLSYIDTTVEYGKSYNYVVRIYAKDGTSNISNQFSVSVTDATIPHDPDDFSVYFDDPGDSRNGVVKIKFKQNFDVDYKGMRILCKESILAETEWKEIKFVNQTGAQGSEIAVSLPGLIEGKYYDISIQAQDYFGNLSDKKTQESVLIIDNVAPNPVRNLTTVTVAGSPICTRTTWNIPSSLDGISDVYGYIIERAEITTGQQVYIEKQVINFFTTLSYFDDTVELAKTYIYRVCAIDEKGNKSDYSYSNKITIEEVSNSISASIISNNLDENTFPFSVTLSNMTESYGHSFVAAIYKKSTGTLISRQIIVTSATNQTSISFYLEYTQLLENFVQSVQNEAFDLNDFQLRFYKRNVESKTVTNLIELLVQDFSIDLRPPTIQNFSASYDPKNKKFYLKWDKPSFSILYGYEIRYAGIGTAKTWENSTSIKQIFSKNITDTVIDIPSDIDLLIAQQTANFYIKPLSRFDFSYLTGLTKVIGQSNLIYSSTPSASSVTVYGKLPAITGMVVTGDVQSVIIKFTPLDTSVHKGVKEYWIYASYTESDLANPTAQMIAWKGQASMPVINRMPDGNVIPNEVKTIYFKIVAVNFDGELGVLSELFSGEAHDNTIPDYTISFNPNVLVDRLLATDSLTITLSAYDNSGFLTTGCLYASLDDEDFVSKTYSLSNENKSLSYQETLSGILTGQHKILFKVYDKYNNFITTQVYNFEVDLNVPSVLPAPYILKDNSFVQTMQIALSGKTFLPLTGTKDSIDIFNSKTVQVCIPSFTTCSNFSHIKLYVAEYNISTSSYGEYVEIKMPQSANLPSSTVIPDFKATVTFSEDMPDFKIKAIQVKKNGILGDVNSAIASTKNKIDTTPPLIKLNSIRYENDVTLENVANSNFINSRIINGGLIIDLTIIEANSGLWSNAVDVENLRMPVYYQINGGQKLPLLEYGSSMFKSPFYIPKEQFSSFNEGDKVTITIYAMDNALKIGSLNIVKIMNKVAPGNVTSQKAIFGVESNKPVIKILYTKPSALDLAGIRLYESGVLIKETLGEVMSIPTSSGSDRAFVLKSVDVADNESSGVSFTAHNYAPSTVTGLNAEPDINALSLSWDHVTTDTNDDLMTDLKYYEVSYSKWDGVIVEKTVSNRFLIQLSKEDMAYYNANPSVSITDIKVRAIDYFDLAGDYCAPTTGRPRFIEAVDMTDNVFKFVGTSNRFTGDLTNLFDNSFRGWSVASVVSDDWVQVDMLKPDFISEMKLKFYGGLLSASTAIRFIVAYYDCSTATKAWKYISASNSSHDIGTAVDRQTDETTAKSRYFEYTITKADQGTEEDKLNAFSISMLKTGLSKATFYASAVKIIFLSACTDLGFTAFLPKTRSIYNEFYGDIMYLSSMAAIRSTEDPDTYMTLDKEKLTLTENSVSKLKLGKLYDGSYGLWAYNNIWLGGDENAPQMKISEYSISIGKTLTQYYNMTANSSNIEIGHMGEGTYSTLISATSMATGRDAITKKYNTVITESGIWLGSIGETSSYNTVISSESIKLGYNQTLDKHSTYIDSLGFKTGATATSYYNADIAGTGSIKLGHMSNGVYSIQIDVSDGSNFISMRNSDPGQKEFFRIGKFSASTSPFYQYTAWAKSLCIDANGYDNILMAQASLSGLWAIARGVGSNAIYANAGTGDRAIKIYCGNDQRGIDIQADGSGVGIVVSATDNHGTWSKTNASNKAGVYGYNTGGGVGVYAASTGTVSLLSEKDTNFLGSLNLTGSLYANAQIYAPNMDSGTGTNAVKWNSSTGKLTYDSSSSLRYKHDIERLPFDMNLYNEIKPSKFKYNSDNSNDIGFIAEEMVTLFPDLVILDKNNRPDAIKYDRISVYNVLANQYNNSRIKELENQIAELKELVNSLIK